MKKAPFETGIKINCTVGADAYIRPDRRTIAHFLLLLNCQALWVDVGIDPYRKWRDIHAEI